MAAGETQQRVGSESLTHSRAFREAMMRSEVRRAYGMLVVIALVAVLIIPNGTTRALSGRLVLGGLIGIGILGGIQFGLLWVARRALRRDRLIPTWFIVATVVAESLIPTGMMLSQILGKLLPPYTSLVTPPLLSAGLVISLSTLRLRPWLCIVSSSVAAAGYFGLLMYVTYGLGLREPTTGLPRAAYINDAMLILISGFAAAWVAREVRGYVEAALSEAETRSRIEQDLEVARSIQQALLPRIAPEIEGFEIAGWNRPADQTGGDYYDWQKMPDGNWIVTLADVSGHGIGPAMVTAACRAYVRASSAHLRDLGPLTSRVNGLLAEDLPSGRFVTMASVVISPKRDSVSLLSAGHGPIVMYAGGSGELRDIMASDMPLAVLADGEFGPALTVDMKPGDVLALATDGFVEWARHDNGKREQFGTERLRQSLRKNAHLPATAIIDAITAEVEAFAGGERQQDDLTMVVIRRVG